MKIIANIWVVLLLFSLQVKAQNDSTMGMTKENMMKNAYVIPQKASDISPLLVGEKIPTGVTVANQIGEMVNFNLLISQKPTIVVFYRGGWCPYCSRQLSGLQDISSDLVKMGYQIVAISTDKPEGLMKSVENGKLDYILLSDADVSLAKDFGIAYKAPKDYWGFLPETSGEKNTELLLPVPSVFILDRKGEINFEYINPNFKQRIKPELLKAVAENISMNL